MIVACGGSATDSGTEGATTGTTTGAESTTSSEDSPTSDSPTSISPTSEGTTSDAPTGTTGTTGGDLPAVVVLSLEVAQTHLLPDGERTWDLSNGAHSLHVVGGRSLLALVDLGADAPASPALEVLVDGEVLGVVPLDLPAALPPTEAGGPAYGLALHSATVDAAWVRPGLALRVTAEGASPSAPRPLPVGVDSDFDMWTLPFYLFGADDENAAPISETATPDEASRTELYEKWPIARVNFAQHPAKRVDWPTIIVGPRSGLPAMRVTNMDEQPDGFAVMSSVLSVLGALRDANGEAGTNSQIYAPLLMLTAQGEYGDPGGGLGGGSVGTGDYAYSGIFIHEQGHAFGMPHAADGYADGEYPYIGGSLLGSAWAYDAARRELLAPFIPPGADHAADCLTDGAHQIDGEGRCVKQDLMQSGSGDQAPGYKFTIFSDFNASVIQRYFEGTTVLGDRDVHEYEGGRIFVDPNSSTGYSRWDSLDQRRVEVTAETVDNGLYGFDRGLPYARDVPVHTIFFTLSAAGTPDVSQIYPPLSYQGNLRRQVDPTAPDELAAIVPNTSDVPWYCHASGCDYTLRVTHADQSVRHVLLRGGFRPWFDPEGQPEAATTDPTDGDSFRLFAVNVPGDQPLAKIEVLATPMGWTGLPNDAPVLLTRE
jgi:hypothetical protein